VFLSCITLRAQEIPERNLNQIKNDIAEMAKVMVLTEDQQAKLFEARKKTYFDRVKIIKTYRKGTDDFKIAAKKVYKDFQVALKEVCTKEQTQKWWTYKNNLK
jgi:hypothetical protein